MGFRRWLRGATRIRFDDRTLGNLTKNAAVAGGTVLGGVGGLALAAGGSALGQAALPGSNLRNIAGAGLKGALTSGALNAGRGLLSSAVNRGASAVPGASGTALPQVGITPGAPGAAAANAIPPLSPAANMTSAVAPSPASPGVFRSALNFAKENPTATAMGLQAAGGLATSGSENRLRDAQADALEQNTAETEYERAARRRRDEALAPIWSNLGTMSGGYGNVAANPYLPQGA